MNDEEREALKNFKSEYETCDHYSSDLIIELDDAEIILNLIEKQQKEIEELKDIKKELTERVLRLESDMFWDNVVSKDKIKNKLNEITDEYHNKILSNEKLSLENININTQRYNAMRIVLEELLEEE